MAFREFPPAPVQGSFTNQRLQLSVGSAQQATNTLSSADRAFAEAAKDLVFTADVKGVRIEGKFSGPRDSRARGKAGGRCIAGVGRSSRRARCQE